MANTLRAVCCCFWAIVFLLPTGSSGQWTSHQLSEDHTLTDRGNSQTPGGSGGSGFGYELLRNQLDEMQGGISQLQQNAGRCGEYEAGIAALQTGITALLRRLEGIEKTLKESPKPASRDTNGDLLNSLVRRLENTLHNRQSVTERSQVVQTTTSIHDKVYDSCDDVPSTGVWLIRYGRMITNTYCYNL